MIPANSAEWFRLRTWLDERVAKIHAQMETCNDDRTMLRYQGRLAQIRELIAAVETKETPKLEAGSVTY